MFLDNNRIENGASKQAQVGQSIKTEKRAIAFQFYNIDELLQSNHETAHKETHQVHSNPVGMNLLELNISTIIDGFFVDNQSK